MNLLKIDSFLFHGAHKPSALLDASLEKTSWERYFSGAQYRQSNNRAGLMEVYINQQLVS